MTNLVKGIGWVFLNLKLVVTHFEHPEPILLIEVNSTPAKLIFFHVTGVTDSCPGSCFTVAVSE